MSATLAASASEPVPNFKRCSIIVEVILAPISSLARLRLFTYLFISVNHLGLAMVDIKVLPKFPKLSTMERLMRILEAMF